jgi:hypothetical protein
VLKGDIILVYFQSARYNAQYSRVQYEFVYQGLSSTWPVVRMLMIGTILRLSAQPIFFFTKLNTYPNFERPSKIAHWNFFFAISGVVNRHFFNNYLSCDQQYQKMAEKIKINLSNGQKKSSDEQFLKASQN